MKVLFLLQNNGFGGAERFVLELAKELAARGNSCSLAFEKEGEFTRAAEAQDMECVRLGLGRADAFTAPSRLAGLCREKGIDVIHAQFPREAAFAARALGSCGAGLVYTDHSALRQGLKWKAFNRLLPEEGFAAVAITEEGRRVLSDNGVTEKCILVIPNGVPAADITGEQRAQARSLVRKAFGLSEDCFIIASLCRFSPEKGVDLLPAVAQKLRELYDGPFAIVAGGEGPLLKETSEKARRLGLSDKLILPGQLGASGQGLSDKQMLPGSGVGNAESVPCTAQLLAASDLYLSPSRAEVMSLSVLEAMSFGLPLVLTDAGAGRELALGGEPCGACVPPGDAELLAKAAYGLIKDPELAAAYGKAAAKKARESYSIEKMTERYLDVYNRVCRRPL